MPAPIIAAAGKVALKVGSQIAIKAGAKSLSSPTGKKLLVGLAIVSILLPIAGLLAVAALGGSFISAVSGGNDTAVKTRCIDSNGNLTPDAGSDILSLTSIQRAAASTIIGVAKSAQLVRGGTTDDTTRQQAARIAIATAMQESHLINLDSGDRDSLGLFQQRPSMGWGTPEQLTDPVYAATAFFYGAGSNHGLVDISGWTTMELTAAAQAVQRSGMPTAYAKWEQFATDLVASMWSTAGPVPVHPALDRPELSDPNSVWSPIPVNIPGGDVTCASPDDITQNWDGIYATPAPWGGYSNGQIPPNVLCVVPWSPTFLLRCDAAAALAAVNEAYKAEHGGASLGLASAYRDYQGQVQARIDWCARGACRNAAIPGTSNHGLAMAVDFANFGSIGDYTSPAYLWMRENGPRFGWVHPPFMEADGSGPYEPWHFEFMGTPTETPTL